MWMDGVRHWWFGKNVIRCVFSCEMLFIENNSMFTVAACALKQRSING